MAVAQWKKEQQKWDSIEVSDDEDDKPKKIKPEGILASQYGRDLLAHEVTQRFYWRAVAAAKKDPSSEEEDEALMAWLITQQNRENPDNQPIAARIIAFHEKRELPSEELVTKVLQALRKRQCQLESNKVRLHPKFVGAVEMLTCGLNTLVACNEAGGARALFERLAAAPHSAFTKKYLKHGFAEDRVQVEEKKQRVIDWKNKNPIAKGFNTVLNTAFDTIDFVSARGGMKMVGACVFGVMAAINGLSALRGMLDANTTGGVAQP